MNAPQTYLFTSARLGFRNWLSSDVDAMAAVNGDEEVMAFFPGTVSREQTISFINRMQQQYSSKGFCYFAVDKLEDGIFIGFIGLSVPAYEAAFTPCVDIGWRLSRKVWGQGLATEGAARCLDYAFLDLGLHTVYAVAPRVNTRSERVMQKVGMSRQYEFEHPLLLQDDRLRTCVLYRKTNRIENQAG